MNNIYGSANEGLANISQNSQIFTKESILKVNHSKLFFRYASEKIRVNSNDTIK